MCDIRLQKIVLNISTKKQQKTPISQHSWLSSCQKYCAFSQFNCYQSMYYDSWTCCLLHVLVVFAEALVIFSLLMWQLMRHLSVSPILRAFLSFLFFFLFFFWFWGVVFIHTRIRWIYVMSCVLQAGRLAAHLAMQKLKHRTLHANCSTKLLHIYHAHRHHWLLPFYTAFTDLDLALWSPDQHKAKLIGFIFSHTFRLIRMKFDVAMK